MDKLLAKLPFDTKDFVAIALFVLAVGLAMAVVKRTPVLKNL